MKALARMNSCRALLLTICLLLAAGAGRAQNSFLEATRHEQARDYESASAKYEAFLDQHPRDRLAPVAATAVANIHLLAREDPDAAIEAYDRVVTDYPESGWAAEAARRKAECLQEAARLSEAGEAYGRALELAGRGGEAASPDWVNEVSLAATNTHPALVEAVVRECLQVGAPEVVVLSHDSGRDFAANGLGAAVARGGGTLTVLAEVGQFQEIPVPRGKILRTERIAADVLDADVFINMPIAKHHAGSEVTLALKNLMGINWDRIRYHQTDLHQCIAELGTCVRQDLVIMDANHVLLTNGPGGPGEVLRGRQVIAGVDPVAVDTFTAEAFWAEREMIRHIRTAHELGVGEIDIDRLDIREFEA